MKELFKTGRASVLSLVLGWLAVLWVGSVLRTDVALGAFYPFSD